MRVWRQDLGLPRAASPSLPRGDQALRLAYLPVGLGEEEATCAVQNDRLVIWAGIVVILAIVALAAYVVAALAASGPAVAAGVLTAVAAVLAVIPPIIRALRGR